MPALPTPVVIVEPDGRTRVRQLIGLVDASGSADVLAGKAPQRFCVHWTGTVEDAVILRDKLDELIELNSGGEDPDIAVVRYRKSHPEAVQQAVQAVVSGQPQEVVDAAADKLFEKHTPESFATRFGYMVRGT